MLHRALCSSPGGTVAEWNLATFMSCQKSHLTCSRHLSQPSLVGMLTWGAEVGDRMLATPRHCLLLATETSTHQLLAWGAN